MTIARSAAKRKNIKNRFSESVGFQTYAFFIFNFPQNSLPLDMQPKGCIMFCEMDAVFKALADESRRKLLDQLHQDNGQSLGELCAHLDMTRQAVTKHLRILEDAKLVTIVWRGREKLHYLNPVPIHELSERWIGKYERHRLQALSDLKRGLEQNKNKKG
jgi:DNA-binding transcriptional ArsR family regulator